MYSKMVFNFDDVFFYLFNFSTLTYINSDIQIFII